MVRLLAGKDDSISIACWTGIMAQPLMSMAPKAMKRPDHTQPRSWRGVALRLCGSAVILALLFYFLPFEPLWEALRRVPPGLWLVVLGGHMGTHVVGVSFKKIRSRLLHQRHQNRSLLDGVS
jgi:hypothetical protein